MWKFNDLINEIISNFYMYYTGKSYFFFAQKQKKTNSAKLRNKKVVLAQYCSWFHSIILRNLHCELSCATCAIAQKKNFAWNLAQQIAKKNAIAWKPEFKTNSWNTAKILFMVNSKQIMLKHCKNIVYGKF